jgi:hypothetical protein
VAGAWLLRARGPLGGGRWRWAGVPPPGAGSSGRTARGTGVRTRDGRLNFLLCCRCCQAPCVFFSPLPSLDAVSHRPDRSGGFLWRWDSSVSNDLLSVWAQTPVTRFFIRLATRARRLVGSDPIYATASLKSPDGLYGQPPPAPRLRSDSAPQYRLRCFEFCPLR